MSYRIDPLRAQVANPENTSVPTVVFRGKPPPELHAGLTLAIGGATLITAAIAAVAIAYTAFRMLQNDTTQQEFYDAGKRLADALWSQFGTQAAPSLQALRHKIKQIQRKAMTMQHSAKQQTDRLRGELESLYQELASQGGRNPAPTSSPSPSPSPRSNIVHFERSRNLCTMHFSVATARSPGGQVAVATELTIRASTVRPGLPPLPANALTSGVLSVTHTQKNGKATTSYATGNGTGASIMTQITQAEPGGTITAEGRGFCTFSNGTMPASSPEGSVQRIEIK